MDSIFLYIHEPKLKLNVIRLLIENRLPYIEATHQEDAVIKMDLVQDVVMFIEEYRHGETVAFFTQSLRRHERFKNTPILWLLPGLEKDRLGMAAKLNISDILAFPFDEAILLRKIRALSGGVVAEASNAFSLHTPPQWTAYSQEILEEAVETAKNGRYPLCVIRVSISEVVHEEEDWLSPTLRKVLRESDRILEINWGEYIVLYPYTPKKRLPMLEAKLRNLLDKAKMRFPGGFKFYLYGLAYPEDAGNPKALLHQLSVGIHQSRGISDQDSVINTQQQKKILMYKDIIRQRRTK